MKQITSLMDVVDLFPKTVIEIQQISHTAQETAQKGIASLIAHDASERTFENTALTYDRIVAAFSCSAHRIYMIQEVSPDVDLRTAAHQEIEKLDQCGIDLFSTNYELFCAFKAYIEGNAITEQLSSEQRYFLQEIMKGFQSQGLNLPQQERAEVVRISKDLSAISLLFQKNINEGKREVSVQREELAGIDDDFIASLKRDEQGNYILGTDYPTYFMIMDHCSIGETRRKLYLAFNQKAYPENMSVLHDLIAQRDEKARLLGFASYADYAFEHQMVKTVSRAERFISELVEKVRTKADQEHEMLINHLPDGVALTDDGKLKPWDLSYVMNQYKESEYALDDRIVSEYFPTDYTLKGMLSIYETFLGIQFKEHQHVGVWHDDVVVLEACDAVSGMTLGYIVLDLYPRDNKYGHAAMFDIVDTITLSDGTRFPSVSVVVANFPRATATRPSLLKHSDVTTFFHEFGHAIHHLCGSPQLASFSGTNVKDDFVELPSQLFEEWMWDLGMLKKVSRHYETGEPLPDRLLNTMIELKNLTRGYQVIRQMFFAKLSLEYFKAGNNKDTDLITRTLHNIFFAHNYFEPNAHFQASFGHLSSGNYGPKYYGYMWSKVFALDIFSVIREHGLLNPAIGKKYREEILQPGGSVDPNELLVRFLGRDPNQEAFLADMGLHSNKRSPLKQETSLAR